MPNERLTIPIAIIGMACRYPGAGNPRELWENILARRRQFRLFPDRRLPISDYYHPDQGEPDKTHARRAAVIDGFDFDWASRRIPYSTFKSMDIAHWLALETALEAIADAGYTRKNVPNDRTGVLVGNSLTGEQTRANTMRLRWPFVRRAFRASASSNGFPRDQMAEIESTLETCYKSVFPPVNEDTLAGGLSNTIAGRICNFLDLYGGGYTIDGACSSSLLAVATAATGLGNGDLDLALAGGVDISLDPFELVGFAKTEALAMNDMNVYDSRGSGFIPGEGCGFVVLKRLSDARKDRNYVYAILHGWGISSDGGKTGITAPNAEGQARSLKRAYARAPYDIRSLEFIEGHGTGTAVGDRVELEAIALAMSDAAAPERSCGMTSLKSLIGHTKAAAGVGGLIKAVMAVNRRILPPTAACREPHPLFDTKARRLYPVLQGKIYKPTETLRAGVSAMGFGGINCHVTVESGDSPSPELAPSIDERALLVSNQETEIFVLTADSATELEEKISNLMEMAKKISIAELTDLAAQSGREVDRKAKIRASVVAGHPDELAERLGQLTMMIREKSPAKGEIVHDAARAVWLGNHVNRTRVGMLFPGQGSQKLNMAHVLVERFSWGRELVRQTDKWLEAEGAERISSLIYRPLDRVRNPEEAETWFRALSRTENAQPAICLASLLWNRFLGKLGVKPAAVGGHSLGELTAFHAAGAFGARELLRLAAIRGRAMAASGDQAGTMVSLQCSRKDAEDILEHINGYVALANINGPSQMVLSGEEAAVERVIRIAAEKGIQTHRLEVSNAFHTRLVSRAAVVMEEHGFLPQTLKYFNVRLFSNIEGQEIEPGLSLRKHFARHTLAQVDFVAMIRSMAATCDLFIEVGPGHVLTGLANDITGAEGPVCLPVESLPSRDQDLNTALAALFIHGVDINWENLYDGRLVRPFIPPSKRLFIENPCERPFDTKLRSKDDSAGRDARPAMEAGQAFPTVYKAKETLENPLSNLVKLPGDELAAYLKNRGPFLAEVIRADIRHSATGIAPEESTKPGAVSTGEAQPALTISSSETPTAMPKTGTREEMESLLLSVVERITGFPGNSLNLKLRLLDDLNLDSIKAANLVAQAAKEAGLEGQITPLDFANARLSEILDRLMILTGKTGPRPEPETPDILEAVLDQTSLITGRPRGSLDADALVEQDLHIGPDMLKDLIQRCASLLKIEMNVDLKPLLRRSLRQIAGILERIIRSQADGQAVQPSLPSAGEDPWVREFAVELVKEPSQALPEWWGKRQEDNWKTVNTLILSSPDTAGVAESLRNDLFRRDARARTATFDEARDQGFARDAAYSHLIAILPRTSGRYDPHAAYLPGVVERLASVVSPPPASQSPRRRTTVAYIQFGGGYFGAQPGFSHLNQGCASALAGSLHLEREDLRVRVLDFSPALEPEKIAEKAIKEINTPPSFAAVGFDDEMTRRIAMQRLIQPGSYTARPVNWSAEDVILVTGGAKGITSSCAFSLAQTTKARMALIGRSAHPDDEPDHPASREIEETLQKYSDRGLVAGYFSCDVTDHEALSSVVRRVREEMGPVTGVIHGAGLNIPRPADQVSVEEAVQEVSPKIMGALNLTSVLKDAPLRVFVGLSSIIGVTGMPGNAWYGFSNEALNMILRRFEADHPDTRTHSIAYSIWRDEGMGARLGSVEYLKRKGIEAIPTKEGVKRFVHLFMNDPGVHQVIVAARLRGLDTWRPRALPAPENARYLEKLLQTTPGVESVFQAHLTLDQDPYLKDHLFNGSYLFPAVFGLEAMAQVVAHATGESDFSRVRIEEIRLERPITVDPQTGTDIVVWAEVQEQPQKSAIRQVRAGISPARTETKDTFFSATFVLGMTDEPPRHDINAPEKPLNIQPTSDIYRDTLLFQGPLFQRIHKIWTITEANEKGESAVFGTEIHDPARAAEDAFPDPSHRNMLLGDPFFRDSLLQSAALLIPQDTSLPVYIRCLEIYPYHHEKTPASIMAMVKMECMDEREIGNTVIAVDREGIIRERLEGYNLRILKHHDDYPTAADLVRPDERDNRIVAETLNNITGSLKLDAPQVLLKHIPDLHKLSKEDRHRREEPLLLEVVRKAAGEHSGDPQTGEIRWLESGKPVVASPDGDGTGVSLSHDERLCLCVAGDGQQGCDIAPVTIRSREEWRGFLGQARDNLIEALLDGPDTLDRAGTRAWSAMEALRKAAGESGDSLKIISKDNDAVLFRGTTSGGHILILTLLLNLTWGPERVFAIAVQKPNESKADSLSLEYSGYKNIFDMRHMEIIDCGPQGQGVFIQRIPIVFRPSAQLSRTVYFSHYFFWVGEIREASAWPVLQKIGQQFSTGKWGGVTNYSCLRILGEATVGDKMEIRLWASGNGGPKNSTMDLTYDFRKMMADGSYERLAWCEQQTTWVRILDHGIVRPEPYPDYYWNLMKDMLPRYDAPNVPDPLPEPLDNLTQHAGQDEEQYRSPAGPTVQPLLHEQIIETSLDNSNVVGNIYFANYYSWQGQTRDRYFFNLIPEYYRGTGERGELLCLECRVDHLREAMPFDRIMVTMALKEWKRCSATFYFEYFRLEPDGTRVKLAFGEHHAIWVTRGSDRKPVPSPFPSRVQEAFRRAVAE